MEGKIEEALRQLPFPKDANLDPIRFTEGFDSIDFRRMLSRFRTEDLRIGEIRGMIVVGGIEKNGRWEISKSSNKVGDFSRIQIGKEGIIEVMLNKKKSNDSGLPNVEFSSDVSDPKLRLFPIKIFIWTFES